MKVSSTMCKRCSFPTHFSRTLRALCAILCTICWVACGDDTSGSGSSNTSTTPTTSTAPHDAGQEHDTSPDDVLDEDTAQDVSEDVPPTPLRAEQYCEESAAMFCTYYLRCGRMAARDQADCEATFLETCNAVYEPRYIALESTDRIALSRDGLAECADHLETVECAQQIFDLDGPCRRIWAGQVEEGGACAPGLENFVCSEGTVCRLGLDFCGTCIPASPVGGECGGEAQGCVESASCVDGVCVRRSLVGEACSDTTPCVTAAFCGEGGVCESFSTVSLGDACDRSRRCPYKSDCVGGVCVEAALLGESCTDRACTSGRCEDGVCVALFTPGASCEASAECTSGACIDGTCALLPGTCFEQEE